ncbi:hypothetical protein BVY01_01060 [bacterium I07]|nr:hypothetical protein BVY01_01060 [bacterium I07]
MHECGDNASQLIKNKLKRKSRQQYPLPGTDPYDVELNANFYAHYVPAKQDLIFFVKDELKRRWSYGLLGQLGPRRRHFSGLMPFTPSECVHNKKLIETGLVLPELLVSVKPYKKPDRNKAEYRKQQRMLRFQKSSHEFTGMSEKEIDSYIPGIANIGFRFTLTSFSSINTLIESLASPNNFSFKFNNKRNSSDDLIDIHQNVTLNGNSYDIERYAGLDADKDKPIKRERLFSRLKTRSESDRELMKLLAHLDPDWTVTGFQKRTVKNPSEYEVYSKSIIKLFEHLISSKQNIHFKSGSSESGGTGQSGITVDYQYGKLIIRTSQSVLKDQNELVRLQNDYETMLKIRLGEIHWTINHPEAYREDILR